MTKVTCLICGECQPTDARWAILMLVRLLSSDVVGVGVICPACEHLYTGADTAVISTPSSAGEA